MLSSGSCNSRYLPWHPIIHRVMSLLYNGTCPDLFLRANLKSSASNDPSSIFADDDSNAEGLFHSAVDILVHLDSAVKNNELFIPKNPVVTDENAVVSEDEENDAPSTINARDTSIQHDREEYIDSGIKLVKDVRSHKKRAPEILQDLDIYGNFETVLITKRTSMKVIKKFGAFQISSCSWDAIEMKKSATNHSISYQLLYTSCTSNISRIFQRQVRTVRDECYKYVNRQNKYTYLPDYFQDSSHSELLTYDFFDRISGPRKWLSNVNIDVFAKHLKRLHDNQYLQIGIEPPNITIISSSVFSPSSLNEVSEEPISKRTRNGGGTASTHHSRTLINYDYAQWFLGPRSCDLPLRFRVGQDRVFIPFNRRGNHFALLYMFGPGKIIYYLDSLWSDGSPILRTLLRFLSIMASDCKDCEDLAPWLRDFDPLDWKLVDLGTARVPQQQNCNDCGVFVCMFMTLLTCMPRPFLILHDCVQDTHGGVVGIFDISVEEFRKKMLRLFFDRTINVTNIHEFLQYC